MTVLKVSDSTSALQLSSSLSAHSQFGRRAFGPQRRMSQATLVRNIVHSIITHRKLGIERSASFYTPNPKTQALVQAQLGTLAVAPDHALLAVANPPQRLGIR